MLYLLLFLRTYEDIYLWASKEKKYCSVKNDVKLLLANEKENAANYERNACYNNDFLIII